MLSDWCFIAELPAPAPHFARLEGRAALRIVLIMLDAQAKHDHFDSCVLRYGGEGVVRL